jgi:hypothetical protein
MATATLTMDDIVHIRISGSYRFISIGGALLANLSLVIRARYFNLFVRYDMCFLCWKKVVCVLQI